MDRLTVAIEAAVAAGDRLRRKLTQARAVKSKGLHDLVTDADFSAQQIILSRLSAAFPADSVLAEEGRHDIDLEAVAPTWLIDPLDGTSNYARQLPMFAVSIGWMVDRALEIGVIYDPLRRELFYGQRGQGAFVRVGRGRPKRLAVSTTTQMMQACVGGGWPREPDRRLRAHAAQLRVGADCHTVRLFGSAALALAYVAAGRLDATFYLALQPWDVAAGALLVQEAGGQLSAWDGGDWRLTHPQVLASNRALHPALVAALAEP